MENELQDDGQVKESRKTYDCLVLPRYRPSVPVQEMLKVLCWEIFRDGWWGNRLNPMAPTGEVRPASSVEAPIVVEPIAMTASSTGGSSSSSSSSSSGSSLKGAQCRSPLTTVVPSSDVEEESSGVSPPQFPVTTSSSTQAVTSSIISDRQMEASTSTTVTTARAGRSGTRGSQRQKETDRMRTFTAGTGRSPTRLADKCQPESGHRSGSRIQHGPFVPAEISHLGWMPQGSDPHWPPIEPGSWVELHEAARLSICGAGVGAINHALALLDNVQTTVVESSWQQTQTLQAARQGADAFGQPDQIRQLVGQMRYLWECTIILRNQVQALKQEKGALTTWQTKATEGAIKLGHHIERLEQEKAQLQQQLEEARVEQPAQATPPASALAEDIICPWKATTDRLNGDKLNNSKPRMGNWQKSRHNPKPPSNGL